MLVENGFRAQIDQISGHLILYTDIQLVIQYIKQIWLKNLFWATLKMNKIYDEF